MTIQEYIRIAIKGVPKEDFLYYKEYFENIDCVNCIYNGHWCNRPRPEACMEYRVERTHIEFEEERRREQNKTK